MFQDGADKSAEFCRWLTAEIGVTPLPIASFYGPEGVRRGACLLCVRMPSMCSLRFGVC